MSYPPPPGLGSGAPSSLPPRPPPPAKSGNRGHGSSAPAPFTGFAPRAVAAQSPAYRSAAATAAAPGPFAAGPQAPSHYGSSSGHGGGGGGGDYDSSYASAAAPQIRNPFAPPTAGAGPGGRPMPAYDPELEAQIAQWQSAYVPKDDRKSGINPAMVSASAPASAATIGPRSGAGATAPRDPLSSADVANSAAADTGVASVVTGADGAARTVVRSGGGTTWQDASLLEWDPAHFRIFVGNLAGEVTDESLLKAFSRFDSVSKARVVRDKRTSKSKGYGFVAFADGDDYFQAAREMQGKYIGSHPVLIKKSTTDIKAVNPHSNQGKHKGKNNNKHYGKKGAGGGYGGGGGGGYNGEGGGGNAATGAGVKKKEAKTKGGLKILG